MTSPQEEISELASLLQMHILQESQLQDWLPVSPENYEFFKAYALKNKGHLRKAPPPSSTISRQLPQPPPITPTKNVVSEGKVSSPPHVEKKKEPSPQKVKSPVPQSPPPTPPVDDFLDIRRIFSKRFPALQIIDAPAFESKGAEAEKTEVLVLLERKMPQQHQAFLANLAKAIRLCFCSAAVVSTDDAKLPTLLSFEALKGVIGQESTFLQIEAMIRSVPKIALKPVQSYFLEPQQKAELWHSLTKALNPGKNS